MVRVVYTGASLCIPDRFHIRILVPVTLPEQARFSGLDDPLKRLPNPKTREKTITNPQPKWPIIKSEKWEDVTLRNTTHNKDLVRAGFAEIGQMRDRPL